MGYKTSEITFIDEEKPKSGFKTSELNFVDAPKDRYEALQRYNQLQKKPETSNWAFFEDTRQQRDIKEYESQSRQEKIKSDVGMKSYTSLNPLSEEFIGNEPAFIVVGAIESALKGFGTVAKKSVSSRLEKQSPEVISAAMELAKDNPELAKNLIRKETEKLLRKEDLGYPFKDKLANKISSAPPERRIGAGKLTEKEQNLFIERRKSEPYKKQSDMSDYPEFNESKEYPSHEGTPLPVDEKKEAEKWDDFVKTIDKEDINPPKYDATKTPKPEKDISLTKFGEVKEKYYRNLESKMTSEEIKEIPKKVRDEEIISRMKSINEGIQEAFTSPRLSKVKEKVIDDWQIVKELENYANVDSSPYLARKMMHKKIGNKIDKAGDFVNEINQDIVKVSKDLNITDKELEKDVFDYLIARHAPERNKELGELAAGITDKKAEEILSNIESKPHSNEIKNIAEKLQKYDRENLDIREASGLVSKETADDLRNKYPHHVPLQRIGFKEQAVASKGMSVKGTGLRKAVGSEREVKDLVKNIVGERIKVVHAAEKNIVDNETYKFVQEYINKYPDQELFEIVKPKAIGKTFDEEIIKQNINKENMLQFQVEGKPTFIKINDPRIASALRGVNRDQVPEFLRYIGAVTRFTARTATTYNPEFAFSNKFRDLQEAIVYLASQKDVKGAVKTPLKDIGSSKDIADWLLGKETPGAKLYQEMHDLGAAGSSKVFSNTKQIDKWVDSIRSQDQHKVASGMKNVLKTIDHWNMIFEDSTRLSAAKQALASGLSKEEAARIFKDATIDFDTMGTWGPVVNSLYMFSNASAQGSAKMSRAMKNPKVAGAVTATVGAASFATNTWNDKVDPEWRNKVSKWDQLNSLNIVLPTDKFNYIAIPASIAIKPILITMNRGYEIANDKGTDAKEATKDVITSIIEGYNPVGGSDLTQTLVPTIARPFVDIARNKSYSGAKVAPETYSKYTPESVKYFDTLEKSLMGRTEIALTKKLSEHGIEISPAKMDYLIQQAVGGTGRFLTKSANTLSALMDKELPEFKEIPFASRFVRTTQPEQFRNTQEEKYAEREISKIEKENFYKNKELNKVLGKNDLNVVYDYLSKQSPEDQIKMIDKVINSIKQQGVTNERWYKQLKQMPAKVRAVIFNNRYRKASPDEQSKMMENAVKVGGILSSDFVIEFAEGKEMK